MTIDEFIKKYRGNYPDVHGRTKWLTWADVEKNMKADLLLVSQALQQTPCYTKLALDVAEFIGRCNLYKENGKWYSVDGLFCNTDDDLLEYVQKLNANFV